MALPKNSVRFTPIYWRTLLIVTPIYITVTVLLDLARHHASWSLGYFSTKAVAIVVFGTVYSLGTWWLGRATTNQNPADGKNA